MGASVGGNNRFVSEINVTPFVDVMLVLLIIFMVATPMMSQGLEVDLPQTKQVEVLPTENDNMMLTVRHDGKIFLDEYEVQTMDDLEGYLQTLVKEKNKTLFLRADKEVPYGVVVDVMGRIKAVGIEKLGVVADSRCRRGSRQRREVVSDELGLVSSFPLPASGGLPADHVLAQLASGEPGDAAGDDQPGGRRSGRQPHALEHPGQDGQAHGRPQGRLAPGQKGRCGRARTAGGQGRPHGGQSPSGGGQARTQGRAQA